MAIVRGCWQPPRSDGNARRAGSLLAARHVPVCLRASAMAAHDHGMHARDQPSLPGGAEGVRVRRTSGGRDGRMVARGSVRRRRSGAQARRKKRQRNFRTSTRASYLRAVRRGCDGDRAGRAIATGLGAISVGAALLFLERADNNKARAGFDEAICLDPSFGAKRISSVEFRTGTGRRFRRRRRLCAQREIPAA